MPRLSLICVELGTLWQPVVSVAWSFGFETVANVDWDWCSDPVTADQSLSYRTVASFAREPLADLRGTSARYAIGDILCYVRGHTAGKIWIKNYSEFR